MRYPTAIPVKLIMPYVLRQLRRSSSYRWQFIRRFVCMICSLIRHILHLGDLTLGDYTA